MNNNSPGSRPTFRSFNLQKAKPELARFHLRTLALILCAVCCAATDARAQGNVKRIQDGLLIQFEAAQVELTAATPEALRLSVIYNHHEPINSSFLAPANNRKSVSWREVKQNGWVGVASKLGTLMINPENGEWRLQDAGGKVIIPEHKIADLTQSISASDPRIQIQLGWNKNEPVDVYGCGNGVTSLIQHEARAGVANGKATLPYYWAKAGYAVLGVTVNDDRPASWKPGDGEFVEWNFSGERADLYLMPAATLKDAAAAYAKLTGAAPVPPRWTFGYLQSRWGWTNQIEVENALQHFQDLKIPVDAFIFDFEWYTRKPDYELADQGEDNFADFGWNTNLFSDLADEIKLFRSKGVRFVGIRKPRLGDKKALAMIRAKGWDLRSQADGVPARDLNFGLAEVRQWYIGQLAPLIEAGIAGWWNDEGESTYTTYYNWNLAERIATDRYRTNARLWTLNRAYSPGTQRFGAATWTGDINSSWDVFHETPTHLLNWSLAGMPYGACDIGGFFGNPSDELISRWMEAGVFFPIMRTHSEVHYKPHLPWLYCDEAREAIRKAINLRTRLIPFYYSLAHETFSAGIPLMRPLVMEFPNDSRVANLTDEWLMGDSLLAAPILNEGGKRSVYLPAGNWYVFGSTNRLTGNRSIEVTAALDEIPTYVRAGTILPLGPVIQNVTEQPGGALELQIYPGKDATFTLVEDDGVTQDYLKGKTRRTTFRWDDAKKELSWKRSGNYSGADVFNQMRVVVFDPLKNSETTCPLTASGSVQPEHR